MIPQSRITLDEQSDYKHLNKTLPHYVSKFYLDTRALLGCRMVIPYRRFGTIHQSHLQGSRSPRRWFRNIVPKRRYGINTTLRNTSEERR
jgi:hypothetical protein